MDHLLKVLITTEKLIVKKLEYFRKKSNDKCHWIMPVLGIFLTAIWLSPGQL